MCLAKIFEGRSRKRRGYKVVVCNGDEPMEYFTGLCGSDAVQLFVGAYAKDKKKEPIKMVDFLGTYPTGFHISLSLAVAKIIQQYSGGVVFHVAFRKEVAWGGTRWHFTGNAPIDDVTVVAKEVKLLEQV